MFTQKRVLVLLLAVALAGVSAGLGWNYWRTTQAAPAATGTYWTCVMHPEIHESGPGQCPKCGMDLVPSDTLTPAEPTATEVSPGKAAPPEAPSSGPPAAARSDADSSASPRAPVTIDTRRQQLIGLRTAPVERRPLDRTIRAVGQLRYDETRLADITLKIEGWIRELYVDSTGKFVKAGDPLFTLYSPQLVTTQNEYLLALRTREQLRGSEVPDAREQADRLVETARQRLELWDLPSDQIARLEAAHAPQTTMIFRSEATGFVIDKQAVTGMHVTPGERLYRLADLSVVWLEADFYEREIPLVAVGQRAVVTLDAYPGERFSGRVVYIYPYVDETTRTVRVRFELANSAGRLKPGMFANVELSSSLGDGLVVPANAVIDSGRRQIVFVSLGDGFFEPRSVTVGARLENAVQILGGLKAGEEVATSANFFIDADSQLRAALEGFEPVAPPAARAGRSALDIQVRTDPDPPRAGDNDVEVVVRDAGGQPVDGAEVAITFFMAAMPSMNMPAMKTDAKLLATSDGTYRGTVRVAMLGRWDVTVTVTKNGERLGSRQLSLVAR